MSETEKYKDKAQTSVVQINWQKIVSDGLLWLNERAWPLGGGILFVSFLYLHNYIQDEQIPLSITSPAVITALPLLFAMLIFMIVMLSSLILLPTAMLFTPMAKGEKPQIECMGLDSENAEAYRKPRKRLAICWLGGLLVVGVFWWLIVFMEPLREAPSSLKFLAFLLTVLAFIVVVNLGQFSRIDQWRHVSSDYFFSCLASSVIQVLVILFTFTITEILASQYRDSVVAQTLCMLGALLFLWFIQIFGAHLLLNASRHQNPIAYVTLIGAVIIGTLGLVTPVSSKLAGYAFQMSASGGKPCAIVTWSPDYNSGVGMLHDSKAGQSMPIRILAKADEFYYARLHNTTSKAVTFVPQRAVAIIDECPDPRVK